MPFARLLSRPAQRYVLKESAVIAYLSGLAYDHSHAVVYKKPLAYNRARMYIYSGFFTGAFGDKPRQQLHIMIIKPMRAAMPAHGLIARIAQHDL